MKKISVIKINIGDRVVPTTIYKVEKGEALPSISRVYVFASNDNGEIALIFNDKRKIWGFPGGHTEKNEAVEQTANRECIEEIGYSLKSCEPSYVLSNKLDDDTESLQVICFAKVGSPSNEFVDENESVSTIKFVPIDGALEKVGNFLLWEDLIKNYKTWLQKKSL